MAVALDTTIIHIGIITIMEVMGSWYNYYGGWYNNYGGWYNNYGGGWYSYWR